MALLEVKDLRVYYRTTRGDSRAVDGVSFTLDENQYLGLVGESGCGKTTMAKALLRVLPPNGRIAGGQIIFKGQDLCQLSEREMRDLRWKEISMIPQSAMNSLDPVVKIVDQIREAIHIHENVSNDEALRRCGEMFDLVGLDRGRLIDYPHQFSGGMRQRAAIAMAMVLNPTLILADEPTTGLDVVVQDQILDRMRRLRTEMKKAMLLVTHNMAVVTENCHRIAVMYAGKIVEIGDTNALLTNPYHPYTLGLRNAFPSILKAGAEKELISISGSPPSLVNPPPGCRFHERCPFAETRCREEEPQSIEVTQGHNAACHFLDRVDEFRERSRDPLTWEGTSASKRTEKRAFKSAQIGEIKGESVAVPKAAARNGGSSNGGAYLEAIGLKQWFPVRQGIVEAVLGRSAQRHVKAVDGVDVRLAAGEVLGLAGESGCGKSTTGMTLVRLLEPTGGSIRFKGAGETESTNGSEDLRGFRRHVQIIFQDPYGSLNPRYTVGRTVLEPLVIHKIGDTQERLARVLHALELAELMPAREYVDRFPHQLSGGQRQRVAIARAIVLEPQFLVADEPVSMLDVSIRAGVLNLLRAFSQDMGIGILYISHDLSTMNHICARTAIMYLGRIVEIGPTESILGDPHHPYAQALISAVPIPDPGYTRQRVVLPGEVPSPIDLPVGCRFAPRCSRAMAVCREEEPGLVDLGQGHFVACYLR